MPTNSKQTSTVTVPQWQVASDWEERVAWWWLTPENLHQAADHGTGFPRAKKIQESKPKRTQNDPLTNGTRLAVVLPCLPDPPTADHLPGRLGRRQPCSDAADGSPRASARPCALCHQWRSSSDASRAARGRS